MVRLRTVLIVVLVCLGAVWLSGCAYRSGFLIPAGVDSIHIQVVSNETFWREAVKTDNLPTNQALATPRPATTMEVDLTERLKNEIVRRTPLKLARHNEADSLMMASIVDVDPKTLLTDAADEILAQRVTIRVDFKWTDLRNGRVLAKGRGVSRPTDFIVERNENFTTAVRKSFDYIAEQIVEQMQEGF